MARDLNTRQAALFWKVTPTRVLAQVDPTRPRMLRSSPTRLTRGPNLRLCGLRSEGWVLTLNCGVDFANGNFVMRAFR